MVGITNKVKEKKMKKHVFENGLVLLYERNWTAKLDSFNVNVNTGSLLESEKEKGINHLVEHLMFKSTKTRTTLQISKELESTGAQINAYTDYDNVCFYFNALPEYVKKCAEIYSDMIFNKFILPEEFLSEKDVVLQEIAMYEDYPSSVNSDFWFKEFYGWDSIAGTRKSVKSITLNQVNNFIKRFYVPQNMVVSICSSLPYYKIKAIVKKNFGTKSNIGGVLASDRWNSLSIKPYELKKISSIAIKKKNTSQVQLAFGILCPDVYNAEIDAEHAAVCKFFSGGLSSILLKEIREKLGLCYSIRMDSYSLCHKDLMKKYPALTFISTSTEKQNVKKCIKEISKLIFSKDVSAYITETDVERVQNDIKSQNVSSQDIAEYNFTRFCLGGKDSSRKRVKKICKWSVKDAQAATRNVLYRDTCEHPHWFASIYGDVLRKDI